MSKTCFATRGLSYFVYTVGFFIICTLKRLLPTEASHHHHIFWKRHFLPRWARVICLPQGRQSNLWWHFTRVNLTTSGNIAISQLSTHRYWSEFFLVAGCLSSHQPTRIREETLESGNLFSGSWISASVPYRSELYFICNKLTFGKILELKFNFQIKNSL